MSSVFNVFLASHNFWVLRPEPTGPAVAGQSLSSQGMSCQGMS